VAQNYPDPNAGNWDKFVLVKANVVDINVTGEGKNNMLSIIDKLDEDSSATVWLPEEIPINFKLAYYFSDQHLQPSPIN
jgi:hypothetical protein